MPISTPAKPTVASPIDYEATRSWQRPTRNVWTPNLPRKLKPRQAKDKAFTKVNNTMGIYFGNTQEDIYLTYGLQKLRWMKPG